MPVRSPPKARLRGGAALPLVLAALLVASLLGLALIETVLVSHRQMQVLARQQQTFWLAEAGVQRALARLADSADYAGEKWEVPADALGGSRPAVVTIAVAGEEGSPQARKIRVEAVLSDDATRRGGSCRELRIALPSEADVPNDEQNGPEPADAAIPAPEDNLKTASLPQAGGSS